MRPRVWLGLLTVVAVALAFTLSVWHDGVRGIRERAQAIGGELRVGWHPGEGTRVVVVLG